MAKISFSNILTSIPYSFSKSIFIDSNVLPIPVKTPGYDDEVIMASGAFTQGSSIEMSCDGPIRSPYIAYQQGGVTYYSGKYTLISALDYYYNK